MSDIAKDGYVYYAFISYNYRDEKFASWLRYRLEHYRLPAVARREIGEDVSIHPVFQYVNDLGVCVLREKLKKELEASKFLIVVCSPNSAKPNLKGEHWVNDETKFFISLGRKDRIIPVIVDGKVDGGEDECYPPAIKEAGLVGCDIRQPGGRKTVLIDVVASLLGLRRDVLRQRHKEEQRKIRRRWLFAFLPLMAAALLGGIFAVDALRPVENYYADYVDSYGLPEGIFSLDEEDLVGRNCHYRFEYSGIRFGKSIHADSSDWSFIRLFNCHRILKRVVQASSLGLPIRRDHTEYGSRPEIQSFDYAADGRLAQIRYLKFAGIGNEPVLDLRLVLNNDRGVVNGLLVFRGEDDKSFAFVKARGTSTTFSDDSAEAQQRSMIAQHQFTRDAAGRIRSTVYLNANGEPMPDGDGVWGCRFARDPLGRTVEVWYLARDGKTRQRNGLGVAGRKYTYGGNDLERGGRCLVRIEYVDDNGSPVMNHEGWMATVEEFDKWDNNFRSTYFDRKERVVKCKKGFAGFTNAYDAAGFQTSATFLDQLGRPTLHADGVSSFHVLRDGRGIETNRVFRDVGGKRMFCRKWGYAEARTVVDSRCDPISVRLYDQEGRLVVGGVVCSFDAEYDVRKNRTRVVLIGSDGNPVRGKEGFAEMRMVYDDRGRMTSCELLDEKGNRTFDKNGVSRTRMEYDSCGNEIRRRFFGVDDRPCLSSDGVSGWKIERTAGGEVKTCTNLGFNGEPVLSNGYAEYRVEEESLPDGKQKKTIYCGVDGKPLVLPEGYAMSVVTYDVFGRTREVRYCDVDGNLTGGKDNVAIKRQRFDDFGNVVEYRFYDAEDKPVCHTDGNHGKLAWYDDRGNETNSVYVAVDGKTPIADKDGVVRTESFYDDLGRHTRHRYLDAGGRPKIVGFGYAEWRKEYDGRGNVVKTSVHGVDGELIETGKNGSAGFESEYDENGFETVRRFFGKGWKPIACLGKDGDEDRGTAGWRAKYNAQGWMLEKTWFDVKGQAATNGCGVVRVVYAYDNQGRCLVNSFYDENDNPMLNADGYAVVKKRYEKSEKPVDVSYFDEKGRPARNKGWYCGFRSRYDERGREVLREAYDENGNLTRTDVSGLAGWRSQYDEYGRETIEERYGVDGTPATLKTGYARKETKRDANGHVVSIVHYDASGRIVCVNPGERVAYSVSAYDASGHELSRRYFGTDGLPCKKNSEDYGWNKTYDKGGNVSRIVWVDGNGNPNLQDGKSAVGYEFEYDASGRIVGKFWIDVNGRRVRHTDGEAGTRIGYDQRGKKVCEERVDLNGRRVIDASTGFAGRSWRYDETNGWETVCRNYGTDGEPICCKQGWARREYVYDRNGNVVSELWFDAKDERAMVDGENGVCYKRRTYDDRGRLISIRYYGADGKLCVSKGDGSAGYDQTIEETEDGRVERIAYVGVDGLPCKSRNGSYKGVFERDRNGNLLLVEWLDENGRLVTVDSDGEAGNRRTWDVFGNELSREYFGVDRKPIMASCGYSRVEKTYDARGNVTSKKYYDEKDVLLMGNKEENFAYSVSTYDVAGNETSRRYYGVDSLPCQAKDELYGWDKQFDGDRCIAIYWVNASGKPFLNEYNFAGQHLAYDHLGRVKSKTWVDVAGKPTRHRDGNVGRRYDYDEKGNCTRLEWVDENGNLAIVQKSGLAGYTCGYDANGAMIFQRNYGITRAPVCNDEGWATKIVHRDANGNAVSEELLDERGNPLSVDRELGIDRVERKYDDQGNIICRRFYGKNGRLCLSTEGVAGWDSTFDGKKQELSRIYYGTDGKPAPEPGSGCEGWKKTFDERGNVLCYGFTDGAGRWKRGKDGYAGWRKTYDRSGRVLTRDFFGVNEEPVAGDTDGECREVNEYDEAGHQISAAWFGVNGKPIVTRGGFSSVRCTFDDKGNETSKIRFGPDGKVVPSDPSNNVAYVVNEFNEGGKKIRATYYGVDGKVVRHRDGNYGVKWEYNNKGWETAKIYVDQDGRAVVLPRTGVAGYVTEHSDDGRTETTWWVNAVGKKTRHADGNYGLIDKFNKEGKLIERVFVNEFKQPVALPNGVAKEIYAYDASGKRIQTIRYDASGGVVH